MAKKVTTGIYLTEPHGQLIYDDKKQAIAKSREFDRLLNFNVLVSGDKAYGLIKFKKAEKLDLEQFRQREAEHKISEEERLKWWPSKTELFFYPIDTFTKYEEPQIVKQTTGAQVFIDNVEFTKREAI